jgi:hypothetical protein
MQVSWVLILWLAFSAFQQTWVTRVVIPLPLWTPPIITYLMERFGVYPKHPAARGFIDICKTIFVNCKSLNRFHVIRWSFSCYFNIPTIYQEGCYFPGKSLSPIEEFEEWDGLEG